MRREKINNNITYKLTLLEFKKMLIKELFEKKEITEKQYKYIMKKLNGEHKSLKKSKFDEEGFSRLTLETKV